MERLNTNVRALDGALQETPEVLQAIRVNIAVHVRLRVVDDLVSVFRVQSIVGLQLVAQRFSSRAWRRAYCALCPDEGLVHFDRAAELAGGLALP